MNPLSRQHKLRLCSWGGVGRRVSERIFHLSQWRRQRQRRRRGLELLLLGVYPLPSLGSGRPVAHLSCSEPNTFLLREASRPLKSEGVGAEYVSRRPPCPQSGKWGGTAAPHHGCSHATLPVTSLETCLGPGERFNGSTPVRSCPAMQSRSEMTSVPVVWFCMKQN